MRTVIWWLQWCVGLPKTYKTLKAMLGNIPAAGLLRGKVLMNLEDGKVYGGVYERDDMEKKGWDVDDECKLGAPMERDCWGRIPSAFANALKAHQYVPRSERCLKMDLLDNAPVRAPKATEKTTTKQTGTQKAGEFVRPTVVSKLSTHVLVKAANKYVVPKHAEVVTGFKKLLIQEKGTFEKAKGGLELVLFTVPLPPCELLKDRGPNAFDYKESMKTLEVGVNATVELGANLVTPSGVMIVIAPLRLPEEWLTEGEQEGSTSNGARAEKKDGAGASAKGPPVRRKIRAQCGLVITKPDKEVVSKSLQLWVWVDEDKGLGNQLSSADSRQQMKSLDVVLWNFEETRIPVYRLLVQ
jgi:hypothetical protein